jgi:uncharacterized protein
MCAMLKAIKSRMPRVPTFNNPRLWTRDYRIAVTGFANSGKSVLLTSLLQHLFNHDPGRFYIHGQVKIVAPEWSALNGKAWDDFHRDFDRNIALLRATEWPDKTLRASRATLRFRRNDWGYSQLRLTLYDLPGERFADSSIFRQSFEDWSRDQLEWLGPLSSPHPEVASYLDSIQRWPANKLTAEAIVLAYKRALAALYAGYHKQLTPSTFVLDQDANYLAKVCHDELATRDWKAVAAARISGLPDGEFAPLPRRVLDHSPDFAEQFAKHYRRYRLRVVRPLFRDLSRCDAVAVLVDLAHILQSGPAVLDDADEFVRQVLDALQPGRRLRDLLLSLLPSRIHRPPMCRVALVASQVDRFHDKDHDNVLQLLRRLAERQAEKFRGAIGDYFRTAAVCSAFSAAGQDVLLPSANASKGFPVARLPDSWTDWPAQWDPQMLFVSKGGFPRLPPGMPNPHAPGARRAAPGHLGLDVLFRFLMGW